MSRNGRAVCTSFGPCGAGTDVVLCTAEDGGYSRYGNPGRRNADRFGGAYSDDIRMNEAAWAFFKDHPCRD